ncbi:DUF5953 family protein [Hyalangium rubrum]|uniref:DUF5953 family protein n=1 Tax=Hyalangium rubrum TaxID=3103134 RepID=A0ABU5H726_9BACT|nr:DUF5953 family protein [Hyalangium sp. s54d21]MDY7229277.1 DUF5953 family protein [Hyalangium sp. s54d21]
MPATPRNDLRLTVHAPALTREDDRPVAVVHAMERALPGLHLGWMISDEGQRIPLPDRDAFVARETKDGGFPLLRNGDDTFRVTVTGWESPAGSSPGGQAHLEVHAKLPLNATGIAAAQEVLEAVAEAARAFWGHATSFRAGLDIVRQTKNGPADLEAPPRGLPSIKPPRDIRSPEIPQCLGWLNYWSAPTARAIGFPDSARDTELLSRARRTPTGGWVVKLTDASLDLDDPTHLDTLLRAYERFPEIGGRSAL